MIDWFILLIPLALLPIFMLLVFVGCTVNRAGTMPFAHPATLEIGEGSFSEVERIEVSFGAEGGEPKASEFLPIQKDEIVIGKTVEYSGIQSDDDVNVFCTCVITISIDPYKAVVNTLTIDSLEWVLEGYFVLDSLEDGFSISFRYFSQLLLKGGLL